MLTGQPGLDLGRDALTVAGGQDRFGGKAVGPDPRRARLRSDVLRQQRDAGLGRRVGGGRARMGTAARGGGDRDDAAAAACLHPGQEALEREERGQEVAVHGGPPAVLGDVLDHGGRGEVAARVGDEDVHRPERFLDAAAHLLDRGEVGDIPGDRHGRAAQAGDGLRRLDHGGLFAPVHRD